MTDKEEIAALRKELDELKSTVKPTSVDPRETERRDREWQNQMYQMQERRMSMATPPSVIRDWNVLDNATVQGIIRDNRNAPTGPTGAIPRSEKVSDPDAGAANTTGWVDPRPLGPQPGIDLIDRGVNAALPHGPEWGKGKR